MFDLLETFRVENGKVEHLSYHQTRVDRSFKDLYQIENGFSLIDYFNHLKLPAVGLFRGRLLYEEEVKSFELLPYQENKIKSFSLCEIGEYDYTYKWADRTYFSMQKKLHPESDEIIFYSKNLIQDCCIANLAFFKNGSWFTPKSPLLEGTTRARLIDDQKIQECDIFLDELLAYERICLINVFRDLSIENSLSLPNCIL